MIDKLLRHLDNKRPGAQSAPLAQGKSTASASYVNLIRQTERLSLAVERVACERRAAAHRLAYRRFGYVDSH